MSYVGSASDAHVVITGGADSCAPGLTPDQAYGCNESSATLPQAQGCAGDPINTATGNFHYGATDFASTGRGGGFDLSRAYNSLDASTDGPFGYGWSSLLGMRLEINAVEATLIQESGSRVPLWSQGGLWRRQGRFDVDLSPGSGGDWVLTRRGTQKITFDASGKLVSIKDLGGDGLTFAYDGGGKVTTITDAAGRALAVAWSGSRVSSITDWEGRTVSYVYDGGELVEVVDVGGGRWLYGYEVGGSHLLESIQSPNEYGKPAPAALVNEFDASGRAVKQWDREGNLTQFEYDSGWTQVTDPGGDVTREVYSHGLRVSLTEGYGTTDARTWAFEYDAATLGISRVVGPPTSAAAAPEWTATYDVRGNRTLMRDPLGRTTEATYNFRSQILTAKDGNGTVTTYSYGSGPFAGHLMSISTPLAGSVPSQTRTISLQRNDAAHRGDVTGMVDPRGKTWSFGYDTNGYRDEVTDPLGKKSTATYDSLGRLTSTVTARGNESGANPNDYKTTFTYNAYGDVLTWSGPEGNTGSKVYDANRNETESVDANEQETNFDYDKANRLVTIHRPDASTLVNEYWPDGALKKQVDSAGQQTTFGYDRVGNLVSQVTPVTSTSFAYDKAGNMVTKTDAAGSCGEPGGCVTAYNYDAANQLKGINYVTDPWTPNLLTIGYDGAGRRTSVIDTRWKVSSWSWDSLGRLTSSAHDGRTTNYGYDLAGNVTSVQDPTGATVTRGYDDAGRLVSTGDGAGRTTSFDFDADRNWTTTTFPSSVNVDTYTYDKAGRMASVTFKQGATTIGGLVYDRDDRGQVTGEDLTSLPGADSTFGYNSLDQLTSQNATGFGYDSADNVTNLAGVTQAFGPGGQICWAGTGSGDCTAAPSGATTFDFDERGNRVTQTPTVGEFTAYGYDQAGRLTSVSTPAIEGGEYQPLDSAQRLVDTRSGAIVGAGTVRTVQVTGHAGVPASGVSAVALTVTAVNAAGNGSLAVYPTGETPTHATALNYRSGEFLGNTVFAKVSPSGQIDFKAASNATHLVVDIQGWFSTTTGTEGGAFNPQTQTLIADTRAGSRSGACPTTSAQCTTLGAGDTRTIQVTGRGGVPSVGVEAVAVNIAAVNPAGNGAIRVWAADQAQPDGAMGPRYLTGQNRSVASVVPVSADGRIKIQASAGTDVVVYTQGWFAEPEPGRDGVFNPLNPARVVDTRAGSREGACPASAGQCTVVTTASPRTIQVTGRAGVPAGVPVKAVALNVKVTHPGASGYATIRTAGGSGGATMQFAAGVVTGNTILVKPSADGRIEVLTNSPSIDVVIDVQGWWGAASESWLYDYDPDGLRISKTAPDGVVTVYDWDKSASVPKLVAETAGTAVTRYVYGPGGVPVEQVNPDGSVTFLHADALGSIRVLTNSGGAKTGSVTYKPFGGLAASTGTLSRLGYAGEYTDAETGFMYLRARFYDPATGQFLSQDPLVALTGQPYQYAANNPVNLTDPLGLCPACGTGGGSGGGSGSEGLTWSTVVTLGAAGACLVPGIGWGWCAGLSATAFAFRTYATYQEQGWENGKGEIAFDLLLTASGIGLGKVFAMGERVLDAHTIRGVVVPAATGWERAGAKGTTAVFDLAVLAAGALGVAGKSLSRGC